MAKVKNKSIHGKVGDVLYRTWNGVQYVSTASGRKSVPDTPAYKENTHGFGVCCKLGAAVSRIMVLADHWEKADVDAFMVRTKFVKFNRSRVLPGGDISAVRLVSALNLHPVNLTLYDFAGSEITCGFELEPPDKLCKEISMQGIVQLTGPKDPACESIIFFPFVSANYRYTGETVLSMKAVFSSQDTETVKLFDNANVLLNLAFKNVEGRVRRFSETKYV